jgi:hypothetical protein
VRTRTADLYRVNASQPKPSDASKATRYWAPENQKGNPPVRHFWGLSLVVYEFSGIGIREVTVDI